jgi:hypothetical protein
MLVMQPGVWTEHVSGVARSMKRPLLNDGGQKLRKG